MAIAHPPVREVELISLGKTVALRPWTMAQRSELRPKIATLIAALAKMKGGFSAVNLDLADLFVDMEDDVAKIVRASIPEKQLSAEEWDEMGWEELPVLAQVVWELNVARADGGGLLGKLGAGLGQALASAIESGVVKEKLRKKQNGSAGSPTQIAPSSKTSKPEGSPSSQGAGAATPSG